MSGKGETYTCDNCGGAFKKGWSDEEAIEEAINLYPAEHLTAEPPGIVCDPCFRMAMEWAEVNAPELLL